MKPSSSPLLIAIFLPLLLLGCDHAIRPEDVGAIHTIWIDPKVKIDDRGFWAGVNRLFTIYAKDNDIDLERIIVEQFRKEIQSTRLLSCRLSEHGDSKLSLELSRFVLQTRPFSSYCKPIVNITAELHDPHGRLLWRFTDYAAHWNQATTTWMCDDYLSAPHNFQHAFELAIRVVASLIVSELAQELKVQDDQTR